MAGKARGPAPQRDSQRRRRNKPESYGDAEPTTGVAAPPEDRPRVLGIKSPEPEIELLWDEIQQSAEAKFYSQADWVRVRLELAYGNETLYELRHGCTVMTKDGPAVVKKVNAQAWTAFQNALTELLISPAAKRRAGIELKVPVDPKAAEADAKILELAAKLSAS